MSDAEKKEETQQAPAEETLPPAANESDKAEAQQTEKTEQVTEEKQEDKAEAQQGETASTSDAKPDEKDDAKKADEPATAAEPQAQPPVEEEEEEIIEPEGPLVPEMEDGTKPLILVSGASGYIASHIVKMLLEDGQKVRGTVRSLENEDKIKHLRELCPESDVKVELVEADLTKPETWEAAVKDCTYVIHVASPFPVTQPKDENEIIQPAVEGTQNILKACSAAKTVKRVVLTSSVVAIRDFSTAPQAANVVYDEESWTDVEQAGISAYAKSKTLAEKAAWDFINELPDDEKFELAVINPAYVMGPVLSSTNACTSMEIPKRLLERAMPMVPKLNFPVVDVRDLAKAHIRALSMPDAAGKRHIVFTRNMWMKEIAQCVSKEFKSQGYNIPTTNAPYFGLWVYGLFDKAVKHILPQVGKVTRVKNARMKKVLLVKPRDPKETIVEMCYSLIEFGLVKKSKKYRGPKKEEAEVAVENPEAPAETEQKEDGTTDASTSADKPADSNGDVTKEKDEEKKSDDKPEEKQDVPADSSEQKTEDTPKSEAEEKKD